MELTDQDRALINDLINIAWQRGGLLEQLRVKLQPKPGANTSTSGWETMAAVRND